MEAAALLAHHRGANDQLGYEGDVSQLYQIVGYCKIPVIIPYFFLKKLQPAVSSFETFVRPDYSDIIPHGPSYLVPVLRDYDLFVGVGCVA